MCKKIFFLVFLLSVLALKAQEDNDFNTSWFNLGAGAAYKGIGGFEGNAAGKIDVFKLNEGKFRLSAHAEVGAGLNVFGFIGMYSHAFLGQLRFLNIANSEYGIGLSTGFSRHVTEGQYNTGEFWQGWNTYRISIQNSDNIEIYTSMNFDHHDNFTRLLTFELGVIAYLKLNKAVFQPLPLPGSMR